MSSKLGFFLANLLFDFKILVLPEFLVNSDDTLSAQLAAFKQLSSKPNLTIVQLCFLQHNHQQGELHQQS
jgi:hypothetical protein